MALELRSLEEVAEFLGVDPALLRGGMNLIRTAEVFGIAPSTLRRKALDGEIGHVRVGHRWCFYWTFLADFIATRYVAPWDRPPIEAHTVTRRSKCRTERELEEKARELGLI